MRDPGSGRSLNDRDAAQASETRQLGETEGRAAHDKAGPYAIVVAVLFVLVVVLLIVFK